MDQERAVMRPELPPQADGWDRLLQFAILFGLAALLFVSIRHGLFLPLIDRVVRHGWMSALVHPSALWMLMGTLMLTFRTLLWFRYRPFAAAVPESAPALTVVIPAYNEGSMVAKSIESVLAADYPRERLEVFVVDDGSRDDTWEHIERVARHHPGLITTVRFAQNQGKRAALAEGFRRARGEIVISIDSDSVIGRNTLLAMVGPFKHDRVGAVAGKVLVYNRKQGFIPRMLHVRFMLSFDFLRAAESTFGTVYCTPGALSAYRVSIVREILDDWLSQTFLNVPSTYGEDRSLTNFILDRGYDSVYQRTGVVFTVVPHTYQKLCKMYLRWDRSYIREDLRFMRIIWKRPLAPLLIALLDKTITNLRFPIAYGAMIAVAVLIADHPNVVPRLLLAVGASALFYSLYYLRSERSLDFVYGIAYAYFALFALWWIFPFAALTVRARSWMTR